MADEARKKRLEEQRAAHYRQMHYRGYDDTFMRPDDEPLTAEEIAAIDAYWGKYKFAYPEIDYKSFETFKNRCGKFDVRHCPAAIRSRVFRNRFVNPDYEMPFQNKGMMEYLYPDFKKPRTLFRRLNCWFFDENFDPISAADVARACCEFVRTGERLIIKPTGAGGGKGISFLGPEDTDPEAVHKLLVQDYGLRALVIQQVIGQSAFMKAFNPSSVNTIRITTLFWRGKTVPLAALIRIGSFGNQVDNWCSGGSLLGLDIETGKCLPWALGNDLTHVTKLPSGLDLAAQELTVPNFDEIKRLTCHAHCRNPYIRLISWDIALDEGDEPVFIECNFSGMIQIHEATTGPVFGKYMDDICDSYLLKLFSLPFMEGDFVCSEYYDRVVIDEYAGSSKKVVIPGTLRGKPVVKLAPGAFKKRPGVTVTVSESIAENSKTALAKVKVKVK